MQKPMTWIAMAALFSGVAAMVGCNGGVDRERFNATISYVLEPSGEIPAGLETVAVLDSGVELVDNEDDDRAKRWSKTSADLIERMINDSNKKYGSGLRVASRRDTTKVLAEKDLAMAGLVEGGAAAQAATLLDVQALITSDLNIRVEVKKSKKTTFDITHLAGGGWRHGGWGSGSGGAREADQIARNMTLQCKYKLIDKATGEAIFDYAPKPFRKMDTKKPGAMFGRSSGEADLDPVDMYIGDLVARGTAEFVSMFVPVEVEYSYELVSSHHEGSAAGVRALRADDYEMAMEHFQRARADDPEDHQTAFCQGVACELMGKWDDALKYYKQACGMPDIEDEMEMYLAAKNRVTAHKDRIRKKEG